MNDPPNNMKRIFLIFLLFALSRAFAQAVDYNAVEKEFESFNHEKVIQLSNELLKTASLSDSLTINLYVMRAISFYSLGEENNSKISFTEILKINQNYVPDPSIVSPKLVSLFNEVKEAYLKTIVSTEPTDSTSVTEVQKVFDSEIIKNSIARNIVLPGWGQLYAGSTTKGIVLSVLSAATLAYTVHFIIDTNGKENDYLNETNKNLIQQKYNSYSSSYKTRNTLIVAYAAIWLFSQLDLILSNDELFMRVPPSSNKEFLPSNNDEISFSVRVPF